jgi:putative NADH-flavin reductase
MTGIQSTGKSQSILIIGATGRTGLETLRHFAKHQSNPTIHAFCRDPTKLDTADKALCTSIFKGDARISAYLERTLAETRAEVVVVSVGNGDSGKKSDVRTASAKALVEVLKKPQYRRVYAVVVSSAGAGNSRIIVGGGLGKLISFHLRNVLADHTGQEAAFYSLRNRTTVVRATYLTDNKATGKLSYFEDRVKSPTIKTDRADLANWIVKEVCGGASPVRGRVVNVTGAK